MIKQCRVCGQDFEMCTKTFDSVLGNYKQFCCSYECGTVYFQKIMDSRNPKQTAEKLKDFNEPILNNVGFETIEDKAIEEELQTSYARRRKNN